MNADETIDLSGIGCPQNSARALLRLEGMDSHKTLAILIDDGEPLRNVPPSLEEEGHTIIKTEKKGLQWCILVKRR
ncbi:MAG: sulfurtransferase TusA family protein [Elusimicrobia bacterium]|nr:sulfurtransferase TusA family protein [Elusimicrobiota bacterium]